MTAAYITTPKNTLRKVTLALPSGASLNLDFYIHSENEQKVLDEVVRIFNVHDGLITALRTALEAIETPGDFIEVAQRYLIEDISEALRTAGEEL